jgi:hypothetical protein
MAEMARRQEISNPRFSGDETANLVVHLRSTVCR